MRNIVEYESNKYKLNIFINCKIYFKSVKNMAGAVGFEPTVHEIKTRCLTTWLHPNKY